MKRFSPLEILALNELPERARIGRTVSLARKYQWRIDTLAQAKRLLERLGEPRGAKTRLTKELAEESYLQEKIRKKRRKQRKVDRSAFTRCSNYDPIAYRDWIDRDNDEDEKRRRIMAICAVRIHPYAKGESEILPKWVGQWWTGSVTNQAIWDGAFLRPEKGYALLIRPTAVFAQKDMLGDLTQQWCHNFRWLVIKIGGLVKGIRVDPRAQTVAEAIRSLKTAQLKKVEKKGYEIKIDWDKEIFSVKSPRRMEWRDIPFKKHSRDRGNNRD